MEVKKNKRFSTHTMSMLRHVYGRLTGKWIQHWPQMEAIYLAWGRGSWDGRTLDPDWLMNRGRQPRVLESLSFSDPINPFGQNISLRKCCFIKTNMETRTSFIRKEEYKKWVVCCLRTLDSLYKQVTVFGNTVSRDIFGYSQFLYLRPECVLEKVILWWGLYTCIHTNTQTSKSLYNCHLQGPEN